MYVVLNMKNSNIVEKGQLTWPLFGKAGRLTAIINVPDSGFGAKCARPGASQPWAIDATASFLIYRWGEKLRLRDLSKPEGLRRTKLQRAFAAPEFFTYNTGGALHILTGKWERESFLWEEAQKKLVLRGPNGPVVSDSGAPRFNPWSELDHAATQTVGPTNK